jgi:hypothetical protein
VSHGASQAPYGPVGEKPDRSIVGDDEVSAFSRSDQLRVHKSQRSARRTRAINPGPGSFRVLAWLGRLGVAGVEPLAVALGLSMRTTYSHLSRLEKEGLVWRVPIRDGAGGAAAISPKGARRLRDDGLPAVAPKSQVPSTGEHSRAVSWVAANFDRRDGFTWLGPAQLRDERRVWRVQRDDGAGHMPDLGVIASGGQRIAIEVELHSKSHDRLRAILRGYRHQLDRGALAQVGYVTSKPSVAALVRRQASAIYLRDELRFSTLDHVIELARARAL